MRVAAIITLGMGLVLVAVSLWKAVKMNASSLVREIRRSRQSMAASEGISFQSTDTVKKPAEPEWIRTRGQKPVTPDAAETRDSGGMSEGERQWDEFRTSMLGMKTGVVKKNAPMKDEKEEYRTDVLGDEYRTGVLEESCSTAIMEGGYQTDVLGESEGGYRTEVLGPEDEEY